MIALEGTSIENPWIGVVELLRHSIAQLRVQFDSVPEVAGELKRYPVLISHDRVFPPRKGACGVRRKLEGSFEDLLRRAKISNFGFHDLRHTFASCNLMNGGDLYELAKILGHSNIEMIERYAKLDQKHTARTGNTVREIWKLMEREEADRTNVV